MDVSGLSLIDANIGDIVAGQVLHPESPGPKLNKQIRVKHYKVFTSVGRFIEGQLAVIPEPEADELIAKGHAVAA